MRHTSVEAGMGGRDATNQQRRVTNKRSNGRRRQAVARLHRGGFSIHQGIFSEASNHRFLVACELREVSSRKAPHHGDELVASATV